MTDSPDARRSISRTSTALLVLAIFVPVFALGGVHTPVLCIAAALVAASAFLAWFFGDPVRTRRPATIVVLTGAGLTLFTLVQALPLPATVLRVLAPDTARIWMGALAPLGEPGPSWASLSLDPTATGVEVLRGLTYLCALVAALRFCERQGGSRFLSAVIAVCATALAITAMLHPMFGAERVFGVYQPRGFVAERHIAPLLNPNHLAAYLNIGTCLALGLALDRRAERMRPIAFAIVLVLASTQVWIASRGGLLSLAFGVCATLLMWKATRRFGTRRMAPLMVPGIIVAAGLAMIVVGASTEASAELGTRDVSKLRIALSGLRLVPHHALFGVGRGSFESAYAAVRTHPGYEIVTHPENLVVQWLTEWGVVVGAAGLAAIAFALRPRVLATSSSPAIGAWSAIATTAVHNLVDFNSEVPAIGITVAVCAAMVVAGRGGTTEGILGKWSGWSLRPKAVAVGLAGAVVVAGAAAWARSPHELDEERATLYDGVRHAERADAYAGEIRAALLRHPAEAYIPFIAAVDATRHGRSVVPWIERTLTLAPVYGLAHLLLAEQLSTVSRAQARLECRLAMSQSPYEPVEPRAVALGTTLVDSYDDAIDLLPNDPRQRNDVLVALTRDLGTRLPATRARLDELLAKISPDAPPPIERAIEAALLDVGAGSAAPWCDGEYSCVQQGLAAADRLEKLNPGSCQPLERKAELLIAANRTSDGLHALREGAQQAADPVDCWKKLGELSSRVKNDSYLEVAEDEVSHSGCDDEAQCAENLVWIAHLEEARGNARRAVGFYQRAHEKAPDRADLVERWAQLATALGMHSTAMEAFRQLSRLSGDPKWQAAAEREKSAMVHDQLLSP